MIKAHNHHQCSPNQPEASCSIGQIQQEGADNRVHFQRMVATAQNNQQQQQDYNYEDVFEDARRQQVLQSLAGESCLNQPEERHEELQQILNKKTKQKEKEEQYKKKEQIKKIRQQNALQFFVKIKIYCLQHFRNAILEAHQVQNYSHNKIYKFLSCLTLSTLQCFQQLKMKPRPQRTRSLFIALLSKIFKENDLQIDSPKRYTLIWALSLILGIGFRKVFFIDISSYELQSFYDLKYQQTKTKKKRISKEIDILRNKLQRKSMEEQLKDTNFVSIQSYSFSGTQTLTTSSEPHNPPQQSLETQAEKLREITRTFSQSFCQIYCPANNNWQLFNMQVLESQQLQQTKRSVLDGKAIIGFFSARILEFMGTYKPLQNNRTFGNVHLRDLTLDFCDKLESTLKRRHRLGCRGLYKNILRQSGTFKTKMIFTDYQRHLLEQESQRDLDLATLNFPKNNRQMRRSEYFVTASLVDKYMMLREQAMPIPHLEFHQEKVYSRSALQPVSSRMRWVDLGRMVRTGEVPLKTTENASKTTTKLYKFAQTEPFQLRLNNDGSFILDEDYNSIYVPPQFAIPQGYALIPQNVEYLCKKHQYKCARVVQGFDVAGMHIVPNNIGCLVEREHQEAIIKIYNERQQKLKAKKEERKTEAAMTLWRKLFKSIIISQQIHRN